MKNIIRFILIRTFGIDPFHKPKPIQPNIAFHSIEVPDFYLENDFNKWAKTIFNEKSKIQRRNIN